MFIVAFYEEGMQYGGGEEGGWWYNTGTLVRPFRLARTKDEAYAIARRANDILSLVQRRVRPVSSMAYSGGRFGAYVYENALPEYFPETRPHYE